MKPLFFLMALVLLTNCGQEKFSTLETELENDRSLVDTSVVCPKGSKPLNGLCWVAGSNYVGDYTIPQRERYCQRVGLSLDRAKLSSLTESECKRASRLWGAAASYFQRIPANNMRCHTSLILEIKAVMGQVIACTPK